jgi:hypothetical protein
MKDWEVEMLELFECDVTVRKWCGLGYARFTSEIGTSGFYLLIGPWIVPLFGSP